MPAHLLDDLSFPDIAMSVETVENLYALTAFISPRLRHLEINCIASSTPPANLNVLLDALSDHSTLLESITITAARTRDPLGILPTIDLRDRLRGIQDLYLDTQMLPRVYIEARLDLAVHLIESDTFNGTVDSSTIEGSIAPEWTDWLPYIYNSITRIEISRPSDLNITLSWKQLVAFLRGIGLFCPGLEHLSLSQNKIRPAPPDDPVAEGVALRPLMQCPRLATLNIESWRRGWDFSSAINAEMLSSWPNLRVLRLTGPSAHNTVPPIPLHAILSVRKSCPLLHTFAFTVDVTIPRREQPTAQLPQPEQPKAPAPDASAESKNIRLDPVSNVNSLPSKVKPAARIPQPDPQLKAGPAHAPAEPNNPTTEIEPLPPMVRHPGQLPNPTPEPAPAPPHAREVLIGVISPKSLTLHASLCHWPTTDGIPHYHLPVTIIRTRLRPDVVSHKA
jgi:hypothetical protein